ncbi:MAG: hypothetical protein AAF390_14965, partial [Pseudomonadota bacterium]
TPMTLALAGALLVAAVPQAWAQDRGARPTFAQVDADGDGVVTRAELTAFGQARGAQRFAAADTDGDGALSRAELTARADDRTLRRLDRIMDRDADGDGRLTLAELGDGRRDGRLFDRADGNGDGVLSQAEWQAVAERRRRR